MCKSKEQLVLLTCYTETAANYVAVKILGIVTVAMDRTSNPLQITASFVCADFQVAAYNKPCQLAVTYTHLFRFLFFSAK